MNFTSHAPLHAVPTTCYSQDVQLTVTTVQQAMRTVACLNNMGVGCLELAKFADAGQYFVHALEKTNEVCFLSLPHTFSQHKSKLTQPLSHNNNGVYQQDEYDEGMNTFCSPLMIHVDTPFQDAICTLLYNLGQQLARVGQVDDALNCFMRALSFVQDANTGKSRGVTSVALLSCIGNMQYRNGSYEEAAIAYSKALGAARSAVQGGSHGMLEVAATLNSLGVLYFHIPSVDASKAMKLFYEALSMYHAVWGFDAQTKEIATLLNNVGRAYYMSKNHEKAIQFYSKSLAMRRFLFGEEHLDVAATICNAGQAKHQLGQLDEAMVLYQEFLVIAEKCLHHEHRDVAIIIKCQAQVHHEKKDYAKAQEMYMRAL